MAGSRIGVLGGSFDPVHIGHLVAAACVLHELNLDKVLMVVANQPWQKVADRDIGDAELRFRVVEAAVAGHAGLEASRLELDRGGPSYTVDTLNSLRESDPDSDLFLILGADAAENVETWHRWHEVAALAQLVVVNRPGDAIPQLSGPWRVTEVEIPAIDVSSTELRARLRAGRPLDFLIPQQALNLLLREGAYPGVQKS